jgi:hypothetical protein
VAGGGGSFFGITNLALVLASRLNESFQLVGQVHRCRTSTLAAWRQNHNTGTIFFRLGSNGKASTQLSDENQYLTSYDRTGPMVVHRLPLGIVAAEYCYSISPSVAPHLHPPKRSTIYITTAFVGLGSESHTFPCYIRAMVATLMLCAEDTRPLTSVLCYVVQFSWICGETNTLTASEYLG